jgi:hypothetical protein
MSFISLAILSRKLTDVEDELEDDRGGGGCDVNGCSEDDVVGLQFIFARWLLLSEADEAAEFELAS